MLCPIGMGHRYQYRLCYRNSPMPAETPSTTNASVSRINGCPKCGTIQKSGKLSCCARGGAWFKKCGNVGDSKFEHTWVEGMQACKSVKSPQGMLSREEATTHPLNIISTQHHSDIYHHPGGVSDAVHTESSGCLRVAKTFAFASILSTISCLQMYQPCQVTYYRWCHILEYSIQYCVHMWYKNIICMTLTAGCYNLYII